MTSVILELPQNLTSGQPHFVSLATNMFTGLHGICLLAVTLWFICQLKHDSAWARWIMAAMKPITISSDWIIMKVTKWIRTSMKWLKMGAKWIRTRPRWIWMNKLHLQRNIFWYYHSLRRLER